MSQSKKPLEEKLIELPYGVEAEPDLDMFIWNEDLRTYEKKNKECKCPFVGMDLMHTETCKHFKEKT